MKKLLTVVCVAAFGIGAVAQAQVVKNESILQTEPKEVKADAADIIGMPAMLDNASMGQLKDATTPWRDTLRWHPEYSEPNCAEGIYSTYYSDAGMFGEEVVPGVFSPYLNGTGEVGATYQTKENLYFMYASIDVENSFVVGAIVIACRMGNTQGWDRIQDKLDRFPQDPEHMNEFRGVKVPDMPVRLMGYGEVTRQRVFESYTDMIFKYLDPVYINVEMPTTTEGRIATGTLYLRYEPRETDDGVRPSYYTLGGLFEGGEMLTASSEKNFGLSMCASLTGDKTYDSLCNYCIGSKSNSVCKFV
ncbi:MAG: hypothetical protein K2I84_03955, partial [Bacteroidales bacterium]|nr:hypothetical protein [Bacteroidales bacterium]